jgi:hypothetical protein
MGCLQMGAPFRTRFKNSGGLAFPNSELTHFVPHFVCEVCTVRETVGREIQATAKDTALIILERARLIDIAHYWATSTHMQYQQRLRHVRKFEANFGVKVLCPPLPRPPTSPDVPAMWLQQQYTLRPRRARGGEPNLSSVSWSTVRGIRSAISQYYSWGLFMGNPRKAMKDHAARPITHRLAWVRVYVVGNVSTTGRQLASFYGAPISAYSCDERPF